MTDADFDRFLSQSLADRRLSPAERSALSRLLEDGSADGQRLALLRSRAFDAARGELAGPDAPRVLDWLEDVVKALARPAAAEPAGGRKSSAHFSPGTACLEQIVEQFRTARRTADVCVFTITDDRVTRAMLAAHGRGVAVRVISDNDKSVDLGSDVQQLRAAGVPVRLDRTEYHMHHKFAVYDDSVLITGSYNWTRGAAEVNEESLIVTADAALVSAHTRAFGLLWDKLA